MINRFKNKKGFTLIELMIVITVIAILSAIALFAFTRVQRQARDAKRKAELKTIQTAIIAFNADNGVYPTTAQGLACLAGSGAAPCNVKYLNSVPVAPAGSSGPAPLIYSYVSTSTSTYGLCTALEVPATAGNMWTIGGTQSQGSEVVAAAACPEN